MVKYSKLLTRRGVSKLSFAHFCFIATFGRNTTIVVIINHVLDVAIMAGISSTNTYTTATHNDSLISPKFPRTRITNTQHFVESPQMKAKESGQDTADL